MKTVGIDIGSYSIKIAELSNSGSSVRIENLSEHLLSQKPGVDKDLELITNLKEVLSQYDIQSTVFVIGLPQDRISTRTVFFPFKEKFKILKSLPFELEDLIPFSSFDAIFEGKIIRQLPNGSEVLAVAAPKDLIQSYLDLAADVQIDPKILSLEGFALNNLFEDLLSPPPEANSNFYNEESFDDDEPSVVEKNKNTIPEPSELEDGEAILDIGHTSSILIVRSSGALRNIRRINWGASNLAKKVAQNKNIQELDALNLIKSSKGILLNKDSGSAEDQQLSELLSEEVAVLGKALKLTLLEIKGVCSVQIKGIGLLGGTSSLPNLGPKLTENTLVATNKVLKIKNYPEIDLSQNNNNEQSMGIAIGLALEAYKRPLNPAINFRRDEFAKQNSNFKEIWSAWGFYINLAAASIAAFFIYASLRNSISEELASTAGRNMRSAAADVFQIKKRNASEQKLSRLFKALETREKTKSKIISTTKNLANAPLSTIKKISAKASSRLELPIDIRNLKVTQNQVKIQGRTSARRELARFTKKLQTLSVGKVSKTERSRDKGFVDFTITFKPKKRL